MSATNRMTSPQGPLAHQIANYSSCPPPPGTGVERVSTRLSEAGQEALSDTVLLTVAEAFSLEPPSPVYLMPGTPLHFRLRTLRANVFHGGLCFARWQNAPCLAEC